MKINAMAVVAMAVALCGVVGLLGCARAQEEEGADFDWVIETGGFPDVNSLEVRGDIRVAGSSTVFPLAEALAARFNDEGYGYNITIDSIGSGAGFERFCTAGESDVVNASRPINESERGACGAIGRVPVEFRIGTDALAVAVNPANDWISGATVEELARLFVVERWDEVDAAWPAVAIERFVPGTDSGTFDYFVEEVFEKDSRPILSAPNNQFSEDDNVLVRGIAGSTYAIGFFGYAYAAENGGALKILEIEGVAPDADGVDDNSYALSRPLFMYSDADVIVGRPQVGAFLAYTLNYVNDEIGEVGYFQAAPSDLDVARGTLGAILRDAGAIQ